VFHFGISYTFFFPGAIYAIFYIKYITDLDVHVYPLKSSLLIIIIIIIIIIIFCKGYHMSEFMKILHFISLIRNIEIM
jgi:hypothetical protein